MLDVIKKRRAVRFFTKEDVSESDVLSLLKAGFQAPTARAQKSFGFVVIRDKKTLLALSEISVGAKVLSRANMAIAVLAINDDLTAPMMQIQDMAAATENILLEATALNLASCWIGVAPIEDRTNMANEILNVKANMSVFSFIALGHLVNQDDLYFKDKFDASRVFYDRVE